MGRKYLYYIAAALWGIPGVRIAAQPKTTTFWQAFPLRGWILIVCMSCLGIALKFIPGIPAEFTASFYSGLGPMLMVAAGLFIANQKRI